MRAAALLVVLAASFSALAQYPAKAVRMVVPFPAGGPTDVLTRVVAQKLAEGWGKPVVIDNMPGAGGVIGSDFVAKSAPDGYTLLMATSSTHSIGPALHKMPYDAQKDFAPVSQAAAAPNALIVSPALGVSDVRGLVALAKGKPGQLNYATSGIGTVPHLGAVLFERLAGIELVHVPYKGTGLAIPDIARGQVALMFDNLITGQQHARAGTVRLLAVTGAKRSALLPDVPTMIEAGVPGYESVAWFGILAPARTPADVIATVNAALAAAVHAPEVRERLAAVGAEPVGGTPEALAEAMRSETEKWRRVVAAGGIKAD